jgi:predicted RNase H-like nuclease (RuvC/YqgF family)
MTLSTREMLEWCRVWKEKLGISNATLSERSRVPKGTIDRILSISKGEADTTDVKLVTIRPIICTLVGCTIEELENCEKENKADFVALTEKCARMSEQLAEAKEVISIYREQNATYKKQVAAMEKVIKEQKKKIATLEKQLKGLSSED